MCLSYHAYYCLIMKFLTISFEPTGPLAFTMMELVFDLSWNRSRKRPCSDTGTSLPLITIFEDLN